MKSCLSTKMLNSQSRFARFFRLSSKLQQFSSADTTESESGQVVYPMSIQVMPNSKLVIYFDSEETCDQCFKAILRAQDYASQMDQYDLDPQPLIDEQHTTSSVITGRHKVTGKSVAIKVFSKPQHEVDRTSGQLIELDVRRKLQESKMSGITKLVEHFEDKNFVYQVTSLMNMMTLQTTMERSSTRYLTLSELQSSARTIVCVVAAMHSAGFIHNDIQPGNILLNREPTKRMMTIALNGFSRCSRIGSRSNSADQTSEESKSGVSSAPSLINEFSHLYLAPEMILSEGADRSVASDVWSLGVLFYTMACGRLPFAGIHQIINQPISWTYADEIMNI